MRFRLIVTCVAVFVVGMLPVSHASAQGFCFNTAVNYATGTQPYSVFAADLNGDGKPDLVVANSGSNNVSVLVHRTCSCPHQGDIASRPDGDGVTNVSVVIAVGQIAFGNGIEVQDPHCPRSRGDAGGNVFVNVNEIYHLFRIAFLNGPNVVDPRGL